MSFATDVKVELSHVEGECTHCGIACLSALLRTEGTLVLAGKDMYRLELSTDIPSVARLVIRLAHELFDLETNLIIRRSVLHKTPNYLIEFAFQPQLKKALAAMGILRNDGFVQGLDSHLIAKQCCQAAYLRGCFMGSGFISNPRGDFHFEMVIEQEEHARALVQLLEKRLISARIMQRRSSYMIYLKSGEAISEFLACVGAHQAALTMENERVVKSVRNDVNRVINAEIANTTKAANASVDQIYAMKKVLGVFGIEGLPQALREVIQLRVSYPNATLKQLGEYASPPLSKSAIYHRIRRIEQLAHDI